MTTVAAGQDAVVLGTTSPERELALGSLPISGELPPWLAGSLVRVTPARWDAGDRTLAHWFDGLAMLHSFGIRDGEVSYANRWLRSRQYEAIERDGKMAYSEFATDPCRSIFKRVTTLFDPARAVTDNGVVNVARLGEQYLALTETPLPVEFDPDTLETLGVAKWHRRIPGLSTTAHPHGDRGMLINYALRYGPRSSYRIYTQEPGGAPRVLSRIRTRKPAYVHSFGLTERYVVFVEFSLVVNPYKLVAGRTFAESLDWEPERGSTFTLVDRARGRVAARHQGPPFFCFHHINAYEEGDEVVVDLCSYDDATIVEALYIDRMRSRNGGASPPPALPRRFRLGPHGLKDEVLVEVPFELPRIDYGPRNGRPYRYVYGASASAPGQFLDVAVKLDVEERSFELWREEGCHPSEPVFVRDPDGDREDDGVALSVVLDARAGNSFLLVLDAASWTELARAEVPQHVPFGFHGQFFR
jgi:beta,beta-carotene 9',10'-dioxygenase